MPHLSNRTMGSTNRWWRRRRLTARTTIADPTALGLLVPCADPPAEFTPAEDAELAESYAAQRAIEADYNQALSRRLRRLGKRAPDLERRKLQQLRVADDAADADQRFRRAEQANQAMRDHGRHLRKPVRVVLVLILALVDVIAYRAAVEVAFDTSDEWPHVIDSYLLALLSIGMVMAAMFAAEQLKALHSARDIRLVDPRLASDEVAHARRVWRQVGIPALLAAVVLLGAGAALRVNALYGTPSWFWLAVPAFSAAALVGAFFVEYKWASKALDERDDLERRAHRARRQMNRADRRLAGVESSYRMGQADIEQLWSTYEPGWRIQLEMAAARVAAARAAHPELFHPLARSVVTSVHARIADGTTRRDPRESLDRLGLDIDQVLTRAAVTHDERRVDNALPAPAPGPQLSLPFTPAPLDHITGNGHTNGNGHRHEPSKAGR